MVQQKRENYNEFNAMKIKTHPGEYGSQCPVAAIMKEKIWLCPVAYGDEMNINVKFHITDGCPSGG
jgi:hypothetical protein